MKNVLFISALIYAIGSVLDIHSTWYIANVMKLENFEEANPMINPYSIGSMMVHSIILGSALLILNSIAWRFREASWPIMMSPVLRDEFFSRWGLKYLKESVVVTLIGLPIAVGVGRMLASTSNWVAALSPDVADAIFLGKGHATTILTVPLIVVVCYFSAFKLIQNDLKKRNNSKSVTSIFSGGFRSFTYSILAYYTIGIFLLISIRAL